MASPRVRFALETLRLTASSESRREDAEAAYPSESAFQALLTPRTVALPEASNRDCLCVRRRGALAVVCLIGATSTVACTAARQSRVTWSDMMNTVQANWVSDSGKSASGSTSSCSRLEPDVAYGGQGVVLRNVKADETCRDVCEKNMECSVWTWRSSKCTLHSLQPGKPVQLMVEPGAVSGMSSHYCNGEVRLPAQQVVEAREVVTTTAAEKDFDCKADVDKWDLMWSRSKIEWCCKHEKFQHCPGTPSWLPYDCEANMANWKSEWPADKKKWCCEHDLFNSCQSKAKDTSMGKPKSDKAQKRNKSDESALENVSHGKNNVSHGKKVHSAGANKSTKEDDQKASHGKKDVKDKVHASSTTSGAISSNVSAAATVSASISTSTKKTTSRSTTSKTSKSTDHSTTTSPTKTTTITGLRLGGHVQSKNKGNTTTLLFNCSSGSNDWEAGWSAPKKNWCCKHKLFDSCPQSTTSSLPYDCSAGASNWYKGWSESKKHWCCVHKLFDSCPQTTTSLPYDCQAGSSNWIKGWSHAKKSWCCEHHPPLGCTAMEHKGEKNASESARKSSTANDTSEEFSGDFCCMAAAVQVGDPSSEVCGRCFPSARAFAGVACGSSHSSCTECGGLAWCESNSTQMTSATKASSPKAKVLASAPMDASPSNRSTNVADAGSAPGDVLSNSSWLYCGYFQCSNGKGADVLPGGPKRTKKHRVSVAKCEAACDAQPECSGIILAGASDSEESCRLLANVDMAACEPDLGFTHTLWVRQPAEGAGGASATETTTTASAWRQRPVLGGSGSRSEQPDSRPTSTSPPSKKSSNATSTPTAPTGTSTTAPASASATLASTISMTDSFEDADLLPSELDITSLPFDCEAGFFNWKAGWSDEKKEWCCTNAKKACESDDISNPYDCEAGLAHWEDGWSGSKKQWCCKHEQKGCAIATTTSLPFDCALGFADFDLGWSDAKREWCCSHELKGCNRTEASATKSSTLAESMAFDCGAAFDNWEVEWSDEQKEWCCRKEARGCTLDMRALESPAAVAKSASPSSAATTSASSVVEVASTKPTAAAAEESDGYHRGLNCYWGAGGATTSAKDPVSDALTLEDCKAACLLQADCEAVVMLRESFPGACFLRSHVDTSACVKDTPYDLWIVRASAAQQGAGVQPTTEFSASTSAPTEGVGSHLRGLMVTTPAPNASRSFHKGVNCYAGSGADTLKGGDPVSDSMSMEECRAACRDKAPDCQGAVVLHESPGPCFLVKSVDLSMCATETPYDLWLDDMFAATMQEEKAPLRMLDGDAAQALQMPSSNEEDRS